MDPVLVTMISVLVAAFLLAYYMDWLGLWVSKKDLKAQIEEAKARMHQ